MQLEKLTTMNPKERATRDVGLYVSEFNSLISRISGLSDKDKEIRFIKGLPNRIFAQLTATESPPTNFNEWTERSLKVYSAFERIREKEAADKKPAPSSSAPKTQNAPRPFIPRTPANSQHVPMDVDASRVDTRKCYNCNKVGHISRDCKEPRKPRVQATTTDATPVAATATVSASTTNPVVTQSPSQEDKLALIAAGLTKLLTRFDDLEKKVNEGF